MLVAAPPNGDGTASKACEKAADVEANGSGGGGGGGSGSGGGGGESFPRAPRLLFRALAATVLCGGVLVGGALLWLLFGWKFVVQLLLVVALLLFLTSGAMQWLYVALATLPRDLRALLRYLGLTLQGRYLQRRDWSVIDVFRERVRKHPNKPCFIFEDKIWTFSEVEAYSNRVAQVFHKEGYGQGDVVALLLDNRPEFVCLWLGLGKLGVVVALININLRQQPLLHSLRISNARALIFGRELQGAVDEVAGQLQPNLQQFIWEPKTSPDASDDGPRSLATPLATAPDTPLEGAHHSGFRDPILYIYTSGTTGLPKAAVIDHSRIFYIAAAMSWLVGFRTNDRFYTPLPLYHTAGGVMTVGQALLFGGTVVMRRKFSASAYFADIKHYECTAAQYIGEMCRYLLAVPPKSEDTNHKLRVVYGNGMRPQIWTQFVKRFGIPQVAEFYGATEGNANIVNVDNAPGAVGFVSRIAPAFYPIALLRQDESSGLPLRNAHGLCMRCAPGEPGLFVGKIISSNPERAFLGYVDKEASRKKVVHDVFQKGDSAFLSGDILVSDKWGYLFFKDRTGDTFRWKGENVSTMELEAIISNIVNYRDCIAYGVQVPGAEGKAGMAAIVESEEPLDVARLTDGLQRALPPYARPLFLRLMHKVDLTGTFKMKKTDLQEDGFDPRRTEDRLLYFDTKSGSYEPLVEEVHSRILAGSIRF